MGKKSLSKSYLREAISYSKQLGYPDKIRLMLCNAKSNIHISNIMAYARHNMPDK